ncbi:hypothetical protein JTB14_011870 [Gonioctena quinquepunctata]|nr:hypothetical protein JTB14_011870 [Gonioctena quinquepunctata]
MGQLIMLLVKLMPQKTSIPISSHKLYSPGFALDTHASLLAGEVPPHCEMCNVQKTIPHMMNYCPKFRLEQQLSLQNDSHENFSPHNNPVLKGYRCIF